MSDIKTWNFIKYAPYTNAVSVANPSDYIDGLVKQFGNKLLVRAASSSGNHGKIEYKGFRGGDSFYTPASEISDLLNIIVADGSEKGHSGILFSINMKDTNTYSRVRRKDMFEDDMFEAYLSITNVGDSDQYGRSGWWIEPTTSGFDRETDVPLSTVRRAYNNWKAELLEPLK